MNCLVKLSGDVLTDEVFQWIKDLSQRYFVVICVGGGTQINKAFKEAGLPNNFGPLGRETYSLEEKQIARNRLEENQAKLQDHLAKIGCQASVVIPVLDIASVLCHVNGDQFVLTVYHGFDVLYVVTKNDRVEKKKDFFSPYPKVQVRGIP